MKKIIPVIILLIVSLYSTAQISKGSLYLGGQVNYTDDKRESTLLNDSYDRYNLSIYPAIGTAIKENLIAGFDIGYGKVKADYTNSKYRERNTGGGVFLRKYFPIINRLYFFTQARAGVSFQKITNNNENMKGFNVGLALYPGVSFAVNRRVHLESGFNNLAYVNYNHAKSRGPASNTVETDRFFIGSDLSNPFSFSLGVRLLFNKQL